MVRLRSGLSGPKLIHLGEIQSGVTATRRIQILSRDQIPFRILGPFDSQSSLSVHAENSEVAQIHWADIQLNTDHEGVFRETLQILTDHPQQPQIEVDVRANVVSAVK